jgi:hypothetical protein
MKKSPLPIAREIGWTPEVASMLLRREAFFLAVV